MMQGSAATDPGRQESKVLESLGIVPGSDNLHHQILHRVLDAAQLVGLEHHHQLILAQPKNEIVVHFPVKMDDGKWQLFTGYRIQHNDALGPYKGGIRFHPMVSRDDLKGLALHTTIKCALLRLPFGGAAGGVACDPRVLSRDEMMRVVRRFAAAIAHQIGANYDIPGADIAADQQVMAWFADTIAQITPDADRQGTRPIVTGKPWEIGGRVARDAAVGVGFLHIMREMLPELGLNLKGLRFVVAGYGAVGSQVARCMVGAGAKLVSAIDRKGGIANAAGIDPIELSDQMQDEGTVMGLGGVQSLSSDDAYAVPCDLLILAGGERSIDARRAALVRAGVVAEVANAPWTADSDDVFLKRGIDVLPSVLCNGGAIIGAYLEWLQNRSFLTVPTQELDTKLEQMLVLAARRMKLARVRFDCDWRTAAYAAGCQQLGRVYDLRGIFP
ncbi:MAG: Glu/Leu/Phe/Val dehydrogenase [Phycisphaerales bacterium]|nr:Glu/Leu/Phe/Val dehydrogenase [Phycisphaerales bacterium]